MINFCTLFDSHYLTRGLAMYFSLIDTGETFHLFIFCFDDESLDILRRMNLPNVTLVSLAEFENEELLDVKKTRSRAEYCWTCTPHSIAYLLNRFDLSAVTYLDADLYFYAPPSILIEEFNISGGAVLLTRHNFSSAYIRYMASGIYCVQFICFKAQTQGMDALKWWQARCLEWCFARAENGKFGDQKYLDDWTERFFGVHVLEHLGGGVAPWNIQQYVLSVVNGHLQINSYPVVFYHFHNFRYYRDSRYYLGNFRLSNEVVDLFYRPYRRALDTSLIMVRQIAPAFDKGWSTPDKHTLFWQIARFLKGERNVYRNL
jgi:hypothetical protein